MQSVPLTYVRFDIYGDDVGLKGPPQRRPPRRGDKPLVWMAGELRTPPMSSEARIEGGMLLRRLQRGETLAMPESRPMPAIGPRCHELRIDDIVQKKEWRIVYYVGSLAVAVLEVFQKATRETPAEVIKSCKRRLASFRIAEKS
jgi:phage-related protein